MADIEISDSLIYNYVNDPRIYNRGCAYYLQNRVNDFFFDKDNLTMTAIVVGSHEYDVSITFAKDNRILSSTCTCLSSSNGAYACKHAVAVLKKAQKEIHKTKHQSNENRKAVDLLFSYFGNIYDEASRGPVKLELIFNHDMELGIPVSSIELKIGKDRLYIVKSIKDFIYSIDKHQIVEFGKSFCFNPSEHSFCSHDLEIIEFIREMHQNEHLLKSCLSGYYQNGSLFKGKKLYLSQTGVSRLFRIMKGYNFNAYILGCEASNVSILDSDLPLSFSLKNEDPHLSLSLNMKNIIVPLTSDGSYYFFNSNIYHPSALQQKYLPAFFNAMSNKPGKNIRFSTLEKDQFVSEVLPYVQQIAEVQIDESVQQSFYKEKLESKVFFDKHEYGIKAKVEFHYGDEIINPFASKGRDNQLEERILIRDPIKEREIIKIFENFDFKVDKDIVYLSDEDQVFDFIYSTLPALHELSDIYYSESFKSLRFKENNFFSGGVRVNETSRMLEFTFHIDNVDSSELEQIFRSVREKRKYYRLKDGSFIPLNIHQMETISDLIEHLGITSSDLAGDVINLPLYRAAYIDEVIREGNLHAIERNLAFKQMVQNIREPQDMEFSTPDELQLVLRDYQKIGFKWLKTLSYYGLGGILADDMGLGKTLQVIAFILSQKQTCSSPSIVIAPTSLVYNWQEEVGKFVPGLKVSVISGMQRERHLQLKEINDADIVVTSYPLIRRDIDMYDKIEFSYCFLDEAQHIKNPNTSNAKAVKQIKAKGYFVLTGTPIENSLTELWSIFDFVMPGYLLSHSEFIKKYETPIVKNSDTKALKELGKHIKPFILRRMKSDVLYELPEKIESKMMSEMAEEQKKLYLAYLQQAKGELAREISENGFEKSQMKILAALTRLRQLCCHPSLFVENYTGDSGKLSMLEEIIEDAIDSRHRILVFSQFTGMLDIIGHMLQNKKISYFRLDGSTKALERNELVSVFNSGEGKVFLISLKAGGTGLNLTGADMVIHYDPWWNPAVEEQATDRAYRIGQKNVVQVIKLLTRGTIEERIFELQQRKKNLIESVIQPGENLLTKMSKEEIIELFDMLTVYEDSL